MAFHSSRRMAALGFASQPDIRSTDELDSCSNFARKLQRVLSVSETSFLNLCGVLCAWYLSCPIITFTITDFVLLQTLIYVQYYIYPIMGNQKPRTELSVLLIILILLLQDCHQIFTSPPQNICLQLPNRSSTQHCCPCQYIWSSQLGSPVKWTTTHDWLLGPFNFYFITP